MSINPNTYKAATVVWSVIMLFFTLSPRAVDALPLIGIPHLDKMAHFGFFFILAFLLHQSLLRMPAIRRYTLIAAVTLFLGVVTEYLQTKIPNRSGSIWDLAVDIAGGIAGVAIIFLINYRHRVVA